MEAPTNSHTFSSRQDARNIRRDLSNGVFMSQPLRLESSSRVDLITTRTENSRLWFLHNQALEDEILGALARYQSIHGVILYSFVLQGNHDHIASSFPCANRAPFMRDLNAQIARLAKRFIPEVGRGKFWERRYANQELPRPEDIEEYFFYCALQAVQSGLAEHPRDYGGYNSFEDAVNGVEREYIATDWTRYMNAKRWNPDVDITRYQTKYKLTYSRLPGYEHLSQDEYRVLMYQKLEERRRKIVEERRRAGKGFAKPDALKKIKPGATPHRSKRSTRYSHRPIVLCLCPKTRSERLENYFTTLGAYRYASSRYVRGDVSVPFPSGTYRPPSLVYRVS